MATGAERGGAAGEDFARLRAIAEEGRQRPLLGGGSLLIWGLAIAVANLFNWAVVARLLSLPGWTISLGWFAIMGGAALIAGRSQAREASKGDALSTGNRVSHAVWVMGGAFLATLALGLFAFASWAARNGDGDAWLLFSVMPPVVFGVYGIALAATAVAGDAPWLRAYAWAAFAFTIATAILIGQAEQLLLAAVGAVAVSVLPGLRLRAQTRG